TSPILKYCLSGIEAAATATSGVERVFQNLAGLEGEDAPRADGNLGAGLRVAADARVLVTHHEIPKPRNLDLFAPLKRLLDGIEDIFVNIRRFLLREPAHFLVDVLDDVGLGHRASVQHCAPSLSPRPAQARRPPKHPPDGQAGGGPVIRRARSEVKQIRDLRG